MSEKNLSRRKFLEGTAALTGGALAASTAAGQTLLGLTPPQMEGPFFPINLPIDQDNDLVRIQGLAKNAFGKVTHIGGRILNPEGKPIKGALMEIWQCDHTGKYNHPGDRQPQEFDDHFQGYGKTITNENGEYRFRTIKPVSYPGRTPHIHFKVSAQGHDDLTSQMYIKGEFLNRFDGIFMNETPQDRARLVVDLQTAAPEIEDDALSGNFDIVLGYE